MAATFVTENNGLEAAGSPSASGLKSLLDSMKEISKKEPEMIFKNFDTTPSASDLREEMDRFARGREVNYYGTTLLLGGRIWTIILFMDLQLKHAFAATMTPLSATEPRLINLLQTRSSSRTGTISVAKSDVPVGLLLLLEFPILFIPGLWPAPVETVLRQALQTLAPERQSAFMSLYNAWNGYTGTDIRGQGELTGTLNTNAFRIKLRGEGAIKYIGVFDAFSRLNHSPNAIWHWDAQATALSLRTFFSLSGGDEVTVSYISSDSLLKPASERRSKLRDGYRFECMCVVCGRSPAEVAISDARRAEIAIMPTPGRQVFLRWLYGDGTDFFLIDKCLRACELYDLEQLVEPDMGHEVWSYATLLMYSYIALGVEDKAKIWAYRVLTRALIFQQDRASSVVRDAERALVNPTHSVLWKARSVLNGGE